MHTGKCPKCEKLIPHVTLQAITIKTALIGGTDWLGVSYQCPFCRTVLSVSIDPIALKSDTVTEILRKQH